jgi:hypothetical protein
MDKPYLLIFMLVFLFGILLLNSSFKCLSIANNTSRFELLSLRDTTHIRPPLYRDSTLYSGYLGNLGPVRNLILNKKRIDSLLKRPLPIYYALSEKDKKDYILNVDQNAIKTPNDTVIFGKKYRVFSLPVKFTNYSKDTLKYLTMDCSWLDSYFTSNNRIEFVRQICFKNEPYVKIILPHQTWSVYIPIILNNDQNNFHRNFRIGISLQKFIKRSQLFDFDPFIYMLRPVTSNMIWSNEVVAP